MFKILTLNNISPAGLDVLPHDKYEVASEIKHPDAILVRSQKMHDMDIPSSLKAVGRAGAGVNNIPIDKMTAQGIPVFNAPGANANAVKELVITGMLLASRNICQAWDYTRRLEGDSDSMQKKVELGKKKYVGFELPGRTLGVIGLGAIGSKVANAALALEMNVIGFDPTITVRSAWELSADVKEASTLEELLSNSDFLSFHVPLNDDTRNMINASRIKVMKPGIVILNFARDGIIDSEAILSALNDDKVFSYVCDFPTSNLKDHPKVVALPHLGASTKEAEENCAVMVVDEIRDFLENGNIHNSVNFPEAQMPRNGGSCRIAIANENIPNMVGQISTLLAKETLNIIDLLNKSRGEIAYTLLDVNTAPSEALIKELTDIKGVLSVRLI